MKKIIKKTAQVFKKKARRTLKREKLSTQKKNYVVDTSAIINKFIPSLIKKGLKGKIIVPNAVMAELENLANKGREEGFIGLEEVSKFHNKKGLIIDFQGLRPNEMQIRHAKSGAIDALIRDVAKKNNAILITTDLVQAKSAQAYGLSTIFLKPRYKKEKKKKRFFSWLKR